MAISEPKIYLNELYKCPFYWGEIDRIEAEAILKDQPNGSYLWKDPDQIYKKRTFIEIAMKENSKIIYSKILAGVAPCSIFLKLEMQNRNFAMQYYYTNVIIHKRESENFNLLEKTMAFFDKCKGRYLSELLASLNNPVLRKRPFSLLELARNKICNPSITYEEISKLEIPQVLQDYLQEI